MKINRNNLRKIIQEELERVILEAEWQWGGKDGERSPEKQEKPTQPQKSREKLRKQASRWAGERSGRKRHKVKAAEPEEKVKPAEPEGAEGPEKEAKKSPLELAISAAIERALKDANITNTQQIKKIIKFINSLEGGESESPEDKKDIVPKSAFKTWAASKVFTAIRGITGEESPEELAKKKKIPIPGDVSRALESLEGYFSKNSEIDSKTAAEDVFRNKESDLYRLVSQIFNVANIKGSAAAALRASLSSRLKHPDYKPLQEVFSKKLIGR